MGERIEFKSVEPLDEVRNALSLIGLEATPERVAFLFGSGTIDTAVEAAASAAWSVELGTELGIEWAEVPHAVRKKYLRAAKTALDVALPIAYGSALTLGESIIEQARLRDVATTVIEERNEALSKLRAAERALPELLRAEREKTWAEAYPAGIGDERTSMGLTDGAVHPNRENPHTLLVPRTV